jgi:hypothetical protein
MTPEQSSPNCSTGPRSTAMTSQYYVSRGCLHMYVRNSAVDGVLLLQEAGVRVVRHQQQDLHRATRLSHFYNAPSCEHGSDHEAKHQPPWFIQVEYEGTPLRSCHTTDATVTHWPCAMPLPCRFTKKACIFTSKRHPLRARDSQQAPCLVQRTRIV